MKVPSSRPPWYASAFGDDYLERYAHRDHDEALRAVRLVLEATGLGPDSVALDLCCGAGRHLEAMEALGLDAIGGDLSAALLRRAATRGLPVVRLDMRHLPFRDETFDLVANFFTAFGYFESDEENFSVLTEVHRVLRPGGWFLLDFLNAEAVTKQLAEPRAEETRRDGLSVRITRRLGADGRRAEKHVEEFRGGALQREVCESVRLFHRDDFRPALEARGLRPVAEWGDYDGEPWDSRRSPRYLVLARRDA